MNIFGIPLDVMRRDEVASFLERVLAEPRFHRIATVNPEFILLAENQPAFRQALLAAEYRLMDGVGIKLAFWLRGEAAPERISGADVVGEVFPLAERGGQPVFLAVREGGLSSYAEICSLLRAQYPGIILTGGDMDPLSPPESWKIEARNSNIVLSNFGAPEQEIFLEGLRRDPGHIRLSVGVGGAFDFLTGKTPRAPKLFRIFGFEWFWRLILQPRRAGRIWKAVVVFPIRLLFGKMKV